jgi:hypothetical protein
LTAAGPPALVASNFVSLTAPERRLIAVLTDGRRVDLAVPVDETLGDALLGRGFTIEPGRHAVLGRGGVQTQLGTPARDLVDGDLYSIVDLSAALPNPTRALASAGEQRGATAAWWMLGTLAVVAAVVDLAGGASSALGTPGQRVEVALAFGAVSVISAVVWAVRRKRGSGADALTMLAPLALAFSAGLITIPLTLHAGVQLAVVTGLLAAAVLAALLTVSMDGLQLRSASSTITLVLLATAAIWAITLTFGWPAAAAAAISVGAVPPALRALPSTLVNVPEGYHIDYARFMSNRWSVRGAVPVSPSVIGMDAVRAIVDDSSARLVAGTVLLSLVPVIMVPIVLAGSWRADPIVFSGTIALLCALILGLLLIPRHSASPVLRWAPRVTVALVALESTLALTAAFGTLTLVVAAIGLMVVAVFTAIILVPVARGASSLVWSRLADTVEWIAVALALPVGLLAANVLTLMRGMMAG